MARPKKLPALTPALQELIVSTIKATLTDMKLATLEQANGQSLEPAAEQKFSPPLESLEMANGQVEESALDKVKKLEKILCTAQTNPFGTTEYPIFEQTLDGMSMASLQDLAQRVGVDPWGSMPVVKQGLKTAFINTNRQGTLRPSPAVKKLNNFPDMTNPKHVLVAQSLGMKVG